MRILCSLTAAALVLFTGCGGDKGPSSPGVTYTFGIDSLILRAGTVQHVSASAGSSVLSAGTLTWSTSDSIVARVSANGIVVGLVPGAATITARGPDGSGSIRVHVPVDVAANGFSAPLASERTFSNVFDHQLPFEFSDNNGFLLSFWNERLGGIDGHNGWDWPVATGTPVLAAASGLVTFAGTETPFVCPALNNTTVAGLWVTISHGTDDRHLVYTQYGHFSRIDVKVGDYVTRGQQLGLSGTTGCSTGPHLHFSTFFLNASGSGVIVFDPYGWTGTVFDPWAADSRGVASRSIWSSSATPPVYRELRRVGDYPKPAFIAINALRYLGVDDDHNPNNEFIEIAVNPDLANWDFGRDTLKNSTGEAYVIPGGTVVSGGGSLRIYSGSGANSATTLYMGRVKPIWGNVADCAFVVDTLKRTLTGVTWGGSSCAAAQQNSTTAASRAGPPTDWLHDAPTPIDRGSKPDLRTFGIVRASPPEN